MTPARIKPPARRQLRRERLVWNSNGATIGVYVDVGFLPANGHGLGRAIEIFLRPRGPTGSAMTFYGDDVGETISLLLQHGYTLAQLRERFKPGSLARAAIEAAWILAAQEGAEVDPLPDDLAERSDRT